jgi:hypothetical protein
MSRIYQVRRSNRLSSGMGFSVRRNLARVVERVRFGMIDGLSASRRRNSSMDTLEDRRLFNFTLGGAGKWTFLNSGTQNQPAIVMFQSTGGTGAGSAAFTVTDGGGNTALDTITATTVDLGGGAGPFTVNLAATIGVGQVTFTNYTPGASITLTLRLDNATDGNNSNTAVDPTIGAFSLTDADYQGGVADYNGPDNTNNVLGNNYNPTKLGSATVGNVNFTGSAIGSLTVRNVGSTTNTNATVSVIGAGDLSSGLSISVEGGMGVSVGSAGTSTVSAAGSLNIGTPAGKLGQVTIGNVVYANASTGNVNVDSTTDFDGISIGSLTFNGSASGGFFVADGSGVNLGGITVGQITRNSPANTNATSSIAIENTGTTGTISFAGIATTGQGQLNVSKTGGTTVGAVTLGSVNFTGATGSPNSQIAISNGGAVASVTATQYTVAGTASGEILINNNGALTSGLTIAGGLTYTTTGNAQLNVTPAGAVGPVSIGAVVANGTGNQQFGNGINIHPTGANGAVGTVNVGTVTIGDDANSNDFLNLTVQSGGAAQAVGNVTVGAVTVLGQQNSNINVNSSTTGTVGNLQLGNISANGTGGLSVTLGDNDATGTSALTLGNLSVDGGAGVTVNAQNATLGNTTVGTAWNLINGTASLSLTAHGTDQGIGTLGNNNWAISVGEGSGLTVNETATGTVGAITINTSDLAYTNNINNPGTFTLNVTADSDGNNTGAFSGLTVRNAGTNTPAVNAGNGAVNSGPEQRTISSATIQAAQVGNIQIAGSVTNFSVTAAAGVQNAQSLAQATIGNVSFGLDVNNAGVPDSYSDSVTLNAQGGIGNVTVGGDRSVLTNLSADANTDNDQLGNIGAVSVTGQGGFTSLSGSIQGANVGNISVANGNVTLNTVATDTGSATQANRNATQNTIGNIVVGQGNLSITTLTADDGIGSITVSSINKVNTAGTVTLGTVTTDNDAVTGAGNTASIGGALGTISANGDVTITTLDSNNLNDTNFQTGNSIGAITSANGSVTIDSLDVAGNLGLILANNTVTLADTNAAQRINGSLIGVTLPNTNAAGGNHTILVGNATGLRISQNLGLLKTTLGNTDNLTLNNVEVFGNATALNAGEGRLQVNAFRVHNITVPASGPTLQFTGGQANNNAKDAVDLLLDVRNATGLVIDATTTFDSYTANSGSLTINDLTGVTSFNAAAYTGTDLTLAARLANNPDGSLKNYTAGLGAKDTAYTFSLGGLTDSYTIGVANSGRHSFRSITVEGNLNGNIGNDSNRLDGTAETLKPTSPEAIMGDIGALTIQGQWNNAGSTIFVNSIKTFSFGSIQVPDNASPVGFSYETPNAGFNGTANAGGNIDPNASLEVYTALVATPITNLQVPLPTNGTANFAFVGPTGVFEQLVITNTSGTVIGTAELNATGGVFQNIYTFGQGLGFEYSAANAGTAAFTGATNFNYGVNSPGGLTATNVTANGTQAIAFIDSTSTIGNVTITDANPNDAIAPALGDLQIGYTVNKGGATDIVGGNGNFTGNYFTDTGDGNNILTLVVSGTPGQIVRGGIGNISVQGAVGRILSSLNVGTITTTDTTLANRVSNAATGTASRWGTANLVGVIADGTVGAITVQGNVLSSIVSGNTTVLTLGADNALGGAGANADTYGTLIAAGGQGFLGDITVLGGNLGTATGTVTVTVTNGQGVITGTNGGDVISAPFGIGVNIVTRAINNQLTAADIVAAGAGGAHEQGRLRSAIIVGAHTLTGINGQAVPTLSEENDDLTGNVTAIDILGDIVANDDISGAISAVGLKGLDGVSGDGVGVTTPTGATLNAINASGAITSTQIYATGGSPGDITGDILAAGTINGTTIKAGSGTGGSILANIVAGTDGTGALTNVSILADDSIGAAGFTHVISASDTSVLTAVRAGLQTVASVTPANAIDGGNLNSDITVGRLVGTLLPQRTNFSDANLPVFSTNSAGGSPSLTINALQIGQTNASTNLNSNINAAIVAANSVTISNFYVDGNVNGNDGVAGAHFVAAGLGYLSNSTAQINGGTVLGNLGGSISAGTFADTALTIVPGTVLSLGAVNLTGLVVGTWIVPATGTLETILAGTTPTTVSSIVPAFSIGATSGATVNVTAQGLQFAAPQTATGTNINAATGNVSGVGIAAFNGTSGAVTAANAAQLNYILANVDALTSFKTSSANPSAGATNNSLNSGNSVNQALSVIANNAGNGKTAQTGIDVDYDLAGFDIFAVRSGTAFYNGFGLGALTGSLTSNDPNGFDGWAAGSLSIGLFAAGGNVTGSLIADGDIIPTAGTGTLSDSAAFFPGGQDADLVAGLSAKAKADGFNPTNNGSFPGGNFSGTVSAGGKLGTATDRFNAAALAGSGSSTVGVANNGDLGGLFLSGTRDQIGVGGDNNTDIFAALIAARNFSGTVDAGDQGNNSGNGSGLAGGSFVGGIIAGAGNDLNIDQSADNILAGSISGGFITTAGNLDVSSLGIRAEASIGSPIVVGYGVNGGNLTGDINAENDITEIQVWGDVGTVGTPSRIYAGGAITRLFVGNSPFAGATNTSAAKPRATSLYICGTGNLNAKVYQGGQTSSATTQIFVGGSIGSSSNLVLGAQDGLTTVDLSMNANRQQLSMSNGRGLFTVSGADIAAANAANTAAAPAIGVIDLVLRNNNQGSTNLGLTSTLTGTGPLGLRDLLAGDTLNNLTINDGSIRSINVDDDVDIQSILSGYIATLGTAPSSLVNVANSLPLVGAMAQAFNNDIGLIGINGNISVDFNIGTTTSVTNGAPGQLQSIGAGLNNGFTNWAIRAQGSITGGSITSNTGSVGNIFAGLNYSDSVSAYRSIGSLYATTGGLNGLSFTAQTGDIGVISSRDTINNLSITAPAGSLGGIFARNGAFTSTTILVHNNVGPIKTSTDISGITITAETGDVGVDLDASDYYTGVTATVPSRTSSSYYGIFSEAGNISTLSVVAGRDIAGVYSPVGAIVGNVTQYANSNTNLVPRYSSSGNDLTYNITGTGTRQAYVSAVDSRLTAGRNIGSLVALQDVSNFIVTAGGNVGNLISIAGRVGGTNRQVFTVNEFLYTNTFIGSTANPGAIGLGSVTVNPVTLRLEQGLLYVVARGTVGDTDAMLDVGTKTVSTQLVGGTFSVTGGTTIISNAQVEIDPVTLKLRTVALDPTQSSGIGNVFSHTGDVNATLVTSGNIGYSAGVGTNTVVGGVSAPLGFANVNIKAGGQIGGVYGGKGTTVSPDSSFASIGSAPTTAGTYDAQVSDQNPLVLVLANGVTYVVNVTSSTGSVNYTVSADGSEVTFKTISLTTTGANASVQVFTTTGDRGAVLNEISANVVNGVASAQLGAKSNVLTEVKSLVTSGNLSNVLIEGDLDTATINGNLAGGTVNVKGDLGDVTVTGNIGSTNTAAFTAGGLALQVGSGKFGSLTAGGTNFGLKTVTISNGQYLSWANTLVSGIASSFLNAYVKAGSAVLTINNGFLEHISLTATSTSGLVVFASGSTFDTATDSVPTNRGANKDNDAVLAAYAGLGSLPKNTTRPSFKGDNGSNVANVGAITTDVAGSSARVSNLVIEGSIGDLLLNKGALVNDPRTTSFTANLSNGSIFGGVANASVSGSVLNTAVRGNLGKLTASVVQNVAVTGDADIISASKVIDGVRVSGNAGSIASGGPLNNVRVDGSAIQITARTVSGLVVAGSVGVQVEGPTTNNSLGTVFSKATIAKALGLNANNLTDNANPGPNGTKYLGGINIASTAKNVAVGGLISDLFAGRVVNTLAQNLLGQTIDDAYVGVAQNKFFSKSNGVLQNTTPFPAV